MRLTDKRRSLLVALSDGEWSALEHHSTMVKVWLNDRGMIRSDNAAFAYHDRMWTITPKGIAALEASK